MHYYEVAPRRIVRDSAATFTYHSDTSLAIGSVVVVSIGKQRLVGVIESVVDKPQYATKPIDQILESRALPTQLVQLAQWMSDYYTTHRATVWQTILPAGLTKKRRTRSPNELSSTIRERTSFVLNEDQTTAIDSLSKVQSGTALLHGVTGSGKTRVYIELVRRALEHGQSSIVLIPEIALTAQLVDEFRAHFPHVVVAHSRQTEAERHTTWQQVLHTDEPVIVIGARSALFMPVQNLGYIIVDEAHEPSFKQDSAPRYSAIRAATMLGSYHNAPVILGSATPSVVDYYLAEQSDSVIASLPTPAATNYSAPEAQLIDMTKKPTLFTQHRFFSDALLRQIAQSLGRKKQVLLFHNRRGSAPTTLCEQCGWSAACPRCYVPLTLHADKHELLCHICNHADRVPTSCPECHNASIIHKGIGTKLIESEIKRLFPKASVARFDGDASADNTVEHRYRELYDGSIDIIIGTQVIAKGLDLPQLETVGVIQADAGLNLPDYGASERTFQLLAQVIGRVGRTEQPAHVIVQAYHPTDPAVQLGLIQDYAGFYTHTLGERKKQHYPPFRYLLRLTCIYKTERSAVASSRKLAGALREKAHADVKILGPAPAFYERQRDTYRWQLTLSSPTRRHLQELLQHVPNQYWQFELDPSSLL